MTLSYDDYAALPDDGRRYAVPFYWIADPDHNTIDAHRLEVDSYTRIATLDRVAPAQLPPLPDLALVPTAIWP